VTLFQHTTPAPTAAEMGSAAAGLKVGAAINADLVGEDTQHAVAELLTGGTMTWFEEPYWEERYREATAVWSGQPNRQLVAEAADLPPGTALDAGSGEGGDALWLARRGWQVTAVDFATTALSRGARDAAATGVADRINWVHADLRTWMPPEGGFDLVSAQFLHMSLESRSAVFALLAAAVAPGGTLLVVGHDVSDLHTGAHRPHAPELFFTADELAASLDPAAWTIAAADTRRRTALDHEADHGTTVADAVLVARRRPAEVAHQRPGE
jgi:SAM-dependent methyltransferase